MGIFLLVIHLANGEIMSEKYRTFYPASEEAAYIMDHNMDVIAVEIYNSHGKCVLSYGE